MPRNQCLKTEKIISGTRKVPLRSMGASVHVSLALSSCIERTDPMQLLPETSEKQASKKFALKFVLQFIL